MSKRLFTTVVLASVTTASSIVLAGDGSGIRIVVPMPPPASRPSETDVTSVSEAQGAVVAAQKEVAAARADLGQAQGELKRVTRQLQRELETSSEMLSAKEALNTAQIGYLAATQPVLTALEQRADYRVARDALGRARQTAAELLVRDNASTAERLATGQAVLDAKVAVTKLESAAFGEAPEVVTAKANCAEALQRLRDLRAQLAQTMFQRPAYSAASRAVQDAQERVTAADKELAAARQDLASARERLTDKEAARQEVADWAKSHGLPDPP